MGIKKRSILSRIITVIFVIILLVILKHFYGIYKTNYFNDFTKAEFNIGTSSFVRDDNIKYSKMASFKIESPNYNDAIFYKKMKVIPNTPYKLSCMVKTKDVITQKEGTICGAQISIVETVESSKVINGTQDWQKIEIQFNSKNREEIEIGFRLGGNEDNCKGTAWFSDFKLEMGIYTKDTNWNMVCFILKNVDVNVNNKNVKLSMTADDINYIKQDMERFKDACKTLTNGKMTVTYDIIEIDSPVNTVSYSEEHGNYIDTKDVKDLIDKYVTKEEYDHIFVAIRMGDTVKDLEIPVQDWIGLRWNGLLRNRFFKY